MTSKVKKKSSPKSPKKRPAKLKMPSRLQLLTVDIESTAYHESGHAVLALSLDLAHVSMSFGPRDDAGPEEKLIGGRCRFGPMDKDNRILDEAMIGWGGIIAEHLRYAIPDEGPDLDIVNFLDSISSNPLSASDRAPMDKCSEEVAEDMLYKAWKILVSRWSEVDALAKRLIPEITQKGRYAIVLRPEPSRSTVGT